MVKMRSERVRTEISRLLETLRVTGQVGVTNRQVEQWIASKKFFFILALGRSGTTFLAHLLNLSSDAVVFHEPIRSDVDAYRRAFFSPDDAERGAAEAGQEAEANQPPCSRCGWTPFVLIVRADPNWGKHEPE